MGAQKLWPHREGWGLVREGFPKELVVDLSREEHVEPGGQRAGHGEGERSM